MSEIMKETERVKYERYWEVPAERNASPALRAVNEFMARAMEAKVDSILDLGCGQGRATVVMREAGFDAWACDIAHNALNEEVKGPLKDRFVIAPFWEMPFEDGLFDCVFSCDVLEHIPGDLLPRALSEMARVAPLSYVE